MERERRPKRVISSLLGMATLLVLSVVSVAPVQAATNPTLGDLSAANPAANKYAGCVAAVLTGTGVTFGSTTALGADLAAIWPALPTGLSDACRLAVDGSQPQVCVNPVDPATCPAVGAAATTAAADQAVSLPGTWKLVTDGVGIGGYAQAPLPASGASIATATGSFTLPAGLLTDFGVAVTSMTVSVVGRTPNGENGVKGHLHLVDGFGNVTDVSDIFGNPYWGYGCGPGDCTFNSRLVWNCKDGLAGAPANCGGQTLTASFTFDAGIGGSCGLCVTPAPPLGQLVEFQLGATNLSLHLNPTVCPLDNDCLRYDDSRLSYLDGSGQPTVVEQLGATPPSAVIDLASSNLRCLVGVNAITNRTVSCVDVTGASAPLLQTAHAPIVYSVPPTITATANPSGGWQRTPVTVTLTASDDKGPGVRSITYSSTGAQATPETVVAASTAQVVVTADGVTTLTYWATDTAGTSSDHGTLTVQVDQTAPAITCAAASTAWSATNLTIACTATDSTSGLADPTQAQLTLTTSVPAGSETASASTGSATVCDVAGNCSTAGPVSGLKVDRLAPSITISAPSGSYAFQDFVKASYSCSDGGSGVATCIGSVPSGSPIDTFTAGSHTFTVSATDAVGNSSQAVVTYMVAAPTCGNEEGSHEGHHHFGSLSLWWCDSIGWHRD